jgi:hypothetical protein
LLAPTKELPFFKKALPKLRLDEVIVYLAPGLDKWQKDRIEDELEDQEAFGAYRINRNADWLVSFAEWQSARHLHGLSTPEDGEGYDAWEAYQDSFIPSVKKTGFGVVEKRLVLVARDLRKKTESIR